MEPSGSILNLPAELIDQIFGFLENRDIFSVRLSNRGLDQNSFSHFAQRFFRKKGFMITSSSLDVLQQIAQHEGLHKYVQHIWFNPDCYTFLDPDRAPNGDLHMTSRVEPNPAERPGHIMYQQNEAYKDCIRDHRELMYTEQLEEKLCRAFSLLPNLGTVGMRRSEEYSPVGWSKLSRAVGEDPRVLGPIPSGPSLALSGPTRLFVSLLRALARSGVQLQRLYTDAIEVDNVLEKDLPRETLDAACSSILYLELNAIQAWLMHGTAEQSEHFKVLKSSSDFGSGLVRLVQSTPHLKEIGLQVFRDRQQSHLIPPRSRDPTSWQTSYAFVSFWRLVNEAPLSQLSRVKLEKVTTTSQALMTFLRPCALHLKSLKIRDVRLLSCEKELRPWQTVFAFLHTRCTGLRYVLFYHLMHDGGGVAYVQDPPQEMPAETQELLIDHVPPSHGGHALFTSYDHITLEVSGTEEVQRKLAEVVDRHWYHQPLFSYAMDEEQWHTDTSDEG